MTLAELFDRYDPMTVRFFVLQGHYRSPQDFSDQALEAARKGFERLKNVVLELREFLGREIRPTDKIEGEKWIKHRNRFFEFMNDDFNTSGAISVLFDIVRDMTTSGKTFVAWESDPLIYAERLFYLLAEKILGFQFEENGGGELEGDLLDLLVQLRQKYRNRKDWESADEIREHLERIGIVLEDGKDGTKWIKR